MSWIEILLLVGAAHSVFLALTLLYIRRGNRVANRLFAGVLVVFALAIFFHTLAAMDLILEFPHLSKIEPPLVFLFAPLFYLYVQALTKPGFALRRKDSLHFLPFLICLLYLAPFYLGSAQEKLHHFLVEHRGNCFHCSLLYWTTLSQILIYIILVAKTLLNYKKRIRQSFSSIEKINLNWLRNVFIAVALTWIVSFVLQVVAPTLQTGNLVWLLVSINIYLIGYFGLRQPEVFTGPEPDFVTGKLLKKYERSTLTPEKASEYLERLHRFMDLERPHLDSGITLPALAKRLATSTHHLSQVINEQLHQNFFEFINSRRIAEAQQRLADPANLNINLTEIAFEVGFNSISSFNAAFKKHAGVTPSQYRTAHHRKNE